MLSIAAARLGFGPIRAVDNDPVAVETTIANAAVNGVVLEATVLDGESDELPRADVAVANVLLAPVERILARLDTRFAITSGYLDRRHARGAGLAAPRARRARRLGGRSLRAERVGDRRSVAGDRLQPVARQVICDARLARVVVYASGSGTTGSPTRIVPLPRMSARNPPRCTSPREDPGGASRWRWEHGSARRRPTHSTSPIRKRRPTSAFSPIPRVTTLRRASSQEISTPSAASASSASASISVSS